jgi:hypothetical protein
MARNAQAEFDAAYRVMQPQIPWIARNGKILNKDGEVQSRYSKYEDIRASSIRSSRRTASTRTTKPNGRRRASPKWSAI